MAFPELRDRDQPSILAAPTSILSSPSLNLATSKRPGVALNVLVRPSSSQSVFHLTDRDIHARDSRWRAVLRCGICICGRVDGFEMRGRFCLNERTLEVTIVMLSAFRLCNAVRYPDHIGGELLPGGHVDGWLREGSRVVCVAGCRKPGRHLQRERGASLGQNTCGGSSRVRCVLVPNFRPGLAPAWPSLPSPEPAYSIHFGLLRPARDTRLLRMLVLSGGHRDCDHDNRTGAAEMDFRPGKKPATMGFG
jgi:hypothetical protein